MVNNMKKNLYLFLGFIILGLGLLSYGLWVTQDQEVALDAHFGSQSFNDSDFDKGSSVIQSQKDSIIHLQWQLNPGYEYPYVGWVWNSKNDKSGCFDARLYKGLRLRLFSPSQPGSWFFVNAKTQNPTTGSKLVRQSAHADGKSQFLDFKQFTMPEWFAVEHKITPDQQAGEWQNLCSIEVLIQEPNAAQGRLEIYEASLVLDKGSPWPWLMGSLVSLLLAFGFRPSRHRAAPVA